MLPLRILNQVREMRWHLPDLVQTSALKRRTSVTASCMKGFSTPTTSSCFTAPYTAYSTMLFGPHIFGLTVHQRIRAGKLPPYADPSKRNDLFLVVGEIHNKRQPAPSETLTR
jgi:hypothetical protein